MLNTGPKGCLTSMNPFASVRASTKPSLQPGGFAGPRAATDADHNEVRARLQQAQQTNLTQKAELNQMTGYQYEQYEASQFSAAARANLSEVDWRVPRLMYCKDPKYNQSLLQLEEDAKLGRLSADEAMKRYQQAQMAKHFEGNALEWQLATQAYNRPLKERVMLMDTKDEVPEEAQQAFRMMRRQTDLNAMQGLPQEVTLRPGCPFIEVHPEYRREEDIWERKLELRSLDEAMQGDLTKPMPRPVLFAQDFENFQEGRYLKDDCPIA